MYCLVFVIYHYLNNGCFYVLYVLYNYFYITSPWH